MSKAIEKSESRSSFLVLQQGIEETQAIIRTNLGDESISLNDLDLAKNPGQGDTKWRIPGLGEEPEEVSEISGVILTHQPYRVYWEGEYTGGGDPPDCSSMDMRNGIGNPGGKCADCPLRLFQDDKPPKCAARRRIFLLREDELVPMVINLTPINSDAARRYAARLSFKAQKKLCHVITKVTSGPATSTTGREYAKVVFAMESVLPPEMAEQMERYATFLEPLLLRSELQQDDGGEPF